MRPTHQCPIDGCEQQVSDARLLCPYHWQLCPRTLRHMLYDAWDGGRGVGLPEHKRAVRAVIETVQVRLNDPRGGSSENVHKRT